MSGRTSASSRVRSSTTRGTRRSSKSNRRSNKSRRRKQGLGSYRPTSYSFAATSRARLYQRGGNTYIQSRELFSVTPATSGLSLAIPVCPTKWQNTRTAVLSSTFTDFRPFRIRLIWLPTVGSNTQGSVSVGTVFSGARLPSASDYPSIMRSLCSSNGGFSTTAWMTHYSRVRLQTNLRANNFPMYEVSPDDIPFWITVATDVQSATPIGQLCVEMTIALKNPITPGTAPPVSGVDYAASITEDPNTHDKFLNVTTDNLNFSPTVGTEYSFAPLQLMYNTTDQVINPILQAFKGEFRSQSGGKSLFAIDPLFKTIANLGISLIGRMSNSF